MDKKSIIGIVLIFAVLVIFSIINKPSEEEVEAAKHRRDSIAQVEANKALIEQQAEEVSKIEELENDSIENSNKLKENTDLYGAFGNAATGEEEFYVLENNLMKVTFSTKGGRVYSVQLKDYMTHDSLPLILFDGPETLFGLNFFSQNRSIDTEQLYFKASTTDKDIVVTGPQVKKGSEGKIKFNKENPGGNESISFRLEVSPGKYIEYAYALAYNSYLVDFDINFQGMGDYIMPNQRSLDFTWAYDVPRQEKVSKLSARVYIFC